MRVSGRWLNCTGILWLLFLRFHGLFPDTASPCKYFFFQNFFLAKNFKSYLEMSPAIDCDYCLKPLVSMRSCLWPQKSVMRTTSYIDTKSTDVCSIHVVPKRQTLSTISSCAGDNWTYKLRCVIWFSWERWLNVYVPSTRWKCTTECIESFKVDTALLN